MNKLCFKVERSGVHTTFQDKGRFHVQHLGISPGGAMDNYLLKLSNILLENHLNDGAIEFAYQGPRLKLISGNAKIVVTGNVHFVIERQNQILSSFENFNTFETYELEEGDIIDILATRESIYGYLNIQGGFKLKKYYDSVSTLTRANLGPNNGKKIEDNQKIFFKKNSINNIKKKINLENTNKKNIVRVVEGPQFDYFSKKSIKKFFSSPYKVTNNTDRMGMRLDGHKIENIKSSNISSEGIIRGSIQVTGDGCPLVLMADHPTIGGYPKIATVISADFSIISQLSPGKDVFFKKVNIFEAQMIFYKKEEKLNLLFKRI